MSPFLYKPVPFIFFVLYCVSTTAIAAEVASDTAPKTGEIALTGTIKSVDVTARRLQLDAISFTLPSGRSSQFTTPHPKTITFSADALLRAAWQPYTAIDFSVLKPGMIVTAIGRDTGIGFALPVRILLLAHYVNQVAPSSPADPNTPSSAESSARNGESRLRFKNRRKDLILTDEIADVPKDARPVLVPQTGHANSITQIAFSADGSQVASTGGLDNTIIIWNLDIGQQERTITYTGYMPYSLAYSPDSKQIAVGSENGACIFDTLSGQMIKSLDVQRSLTNIGYVIQCVFSSDGKVLIGTGSNCIAAWNIATGKLINFLRMTIDRRYPNYVPNFSLSCHPEKPLVAFCPTDTSIAIWNYKSGMAEGTFSLSSKINCLQYNPDGKWLAAGGIDGVLLMDTTSEYTSRQLKSQMEVWSVTFNGDNTLSSWATTPGGPISGAYQRIIQNAIFVYGKAILGSAAVTDDAANKSELVTWEILTGKPVINQTLHTCFPAATPDRRYCACSVGNGVAIYDPVADSTRILLGHTSPVRTVEFDPSGNNLLIMSDHAEHATLENSIMQVDLATGRATLAQYYVNGVFTTNRSKVAQLKDVTRNGDPVRTVEVTLTDVVSGKVERRWQLRGQNDRFKTFSEWQQRCLAISPDGVRVALGQGADWKFGVPNQLPYHGGAIKIWNAITGELERTLTGHDGEIYKLWFNADGKHLVSWGGTTVITWDLSTGEAIETETGYGVIRQINTTLKPAAAIFSIRTGQKKFAENVVTWKNDISTDYSVKVWNDDYSYSNYVLKQAIGYLAINCWSPDRQYLAVGERQQIALINVLNVKIREISNAQTGHVTSLCFSPDGKYLASGSYDGSVTLWETATARSVAMFFGLESNTQWLTMTPQGYYDCSLEAASMVDWRLGDQVLPFDQFEGKYHRPDLVRRALRGEDISSAPPLTGRDLPPSLIFSNREYGEEVTPDNRNQVTVTVKAAGVRSLTRVEVTVNGRPLQGTVKAGIEKLDAAHPDVKTREFTMEIPVPANQPRLRVRAVAYDSDNLKSFPTELLLRVAGAKETPGDLYLLGIGVSRYKNPQYDLQFAAADAQAEVEAFSTHTQGLYEHIHKKVLTDEQANVPTTLFALRELKDTITENDTLIVFLSGHGLRDAKGRYFFATHEVNLADLAHTTVDWEQFINILKQVRARRIILLADTCHSGSITGSVNTDTLTDRLNRQAGVMVFTASRGEELSFEDAQWKHGAFTKALLEGLEGAADEDSNSGISIEELRQFVTKRVAGLTQDKQHAHLPRLQQFDPGAVIARVKTHD